MVAQVNPLASGVEDLVIPASGPQGYQEAFCA
mgnify:CR=1 FL=1